MGDGVAHPHQGVERVLPSAVSFPSKAMRLEPSKNLFKNEVKSSWLKGEPNVAEFERR